MQISRSDLYRLVSNSPLSKVAPTLGISASRLAAICRDNNVPYPGSGYWTRKSLNQPAELIPLPQIAGSDEATIKIEPEEQRVRPSRERTFGELVDVRRAPSNATQANESSHRHRLHAMIEKWVSEHDRRRREALGSRDSWRIKMAPPPFSDIDHRRHRILDALFHALEAKGAKVSEAEKGLIRVTIDGEAIDFQVREKSRQARVPKEDPRSSHLSQELVGTGKLVFTVRTYLRGPHNEEWRETDRKPLESQLPQIVERLFEGSRILKAWHIEQEQERERWRQEAARKAELLRLARQEQAFRNKLAELAQDWQTAAAIRNLLEAIQSQPFDGATGVHGKNVSEWLSWAEAAADSLDVVKLGAEGVFGLIGNTKVEPQ